MLLLLLLLLLLVMLLLLVVVVLHAGMKVVRGVLVVMVAPSQEVLLGKRGPCLLRVLLEQLQLALMLLLEQLLVLPLLVKLHLNMLVHALLLPVELQLVLHAALQQGCCLGRCC